MNHEHCKKIHTAHRHGWTANEIARVYGYRRCEVQRVIAGEHRKPRWAYRVAKGSAELLAAGVSEEVVRANFGG